MTVARLPPEPSAWPSFAKVNLHLEVVGRRADGFHELRTIFQTVSLADRIEIGVGSRRGGLVVEGPASAGVPADERNLVVQAAEAFRARFGGPSPRIRLHKVIPAGGGLGGGSSNAATVLSMLRQVVGAPERVEDLMPLACDLGSDVAYFLVGGTAFAGGRGERITALPELPRRRLYLLIPPAGNPTSEVFGRLAAPPVEGPSSRLVIPPGVSWPELIADGRNELEAAACEVLPALSEIHQRARRAGARQVRLSGSGSASLVFADAGFGRRFASLGGPEIVVHRVETVSRARIARERVSLAAG